MAQKAAAGVAKAAAKVASEGIDQAAKNAKKLYNKVYFPNTILTLMKPEEIAEKTEPLEVVKFRVSPKLTRIEVANWIEAMYDTPVKKVNTLNYEGKIQRVPGGKGFYKRPDYKVAYVHLESPWLPSRNSGRK
jgi:large subunit ribosomal protein L23